ncbi:hypothetical protein EDM57_19480 [Brevibacillus gelatini]|uniref:Uncharacterized protein n=1 Tax=Brevibacillus gelatini TaxID=1655277 RepID=A0A3M8AQN8_9BACL|nr:hypothetical protein [Brevibacillus gelatini]RNB53480.1 hypothetical protein EDM57_19480 [Brevibacillus gelatini]
MADRFVAGIMASFLFTFGAAIFFFRDRFMVFPMAMFTFPTVFVLGLPQSVLIDWLLRPLHKKRNVLVVMLEVLLYAAAGVVATVLLLWVVARELRMANFSFYVLGMSAALLYYVCLLIIRRQRKKRTA